VAVKITHIYLHIFTYRDWPFLQLNMPLSVHCINNYL